MISTVLYCRKVDLGLGLFAQVEICVKEPSLPPSTGIDWPTVDDVPGVELLVSLPAHNNYQLVEVLNCRAAGTDVWVSHGRCVVDGLIRRIETWREGTLDERVALAEATAERWLDPIQRYVTDRAARLARREATIAGFAADVERWRSCYLRVVRTGDGLWIAQVQDSRHRVVDVYRATERGPEGWREAVRGGAALATSLGRRLAKAAVVTSTTPGSEEAGTSVLRGELLRAIIGAEGRA